jgi:hypothetical protein
MRRRGGSVIDYSHKLLIIRVLRLHKHCDCEMMNALNEAQSWAAATKQKRASSRSRS